MNHCRLLHQVEIAFDIITSNAYSYWDRDHRHMKADYTCLPLLCCLDHDRDHRHMKADYTIVSSFQRGLVDRDHRHIKADYIGRLRCMSFNDRDHRHMKADYTSPIPLCIVGRNHHHIKAEV